MQLVENPRFNLLRGRESDPTLVLDIGPDGKDRSTSALDMTPQADWILGGKYGTGDGTGDYLRNNTANFRSSDSAGMIVAWVRRSVAGVYHSIFATSDTASGNYFFSIAALNNELRLLYNVSGMAYNIIDGTINIPANEWTHVVFGSTGSQYFAYVNAIADTLSVTGGSDDGMWLDASPTQRDNITVGALSRNLVEHNFNGNIASVQYYSALPANIAAWVANDFARGVPDDNIVLAVGSDGKDYSRYGLDFTPQADAIVGSRITLDGTGDYLLNSTANWRSSDSQGAIEAWVRRDAAGAFHTILSSGDDGSANRYILVDINNTNNVRIVQINNDTADAIRGDTTIAAGQWYHVAAACSDVYAIYVNGVVQTLTADTGSNQGHWFAQTTLRDNVTIGALAYNSTTANHFNGDIAGVWYHKVPRSAAYWKMRYRQMRGWFM